MKKQIKTIYGGANSKVADLLVNRLIPAQTIESVGPFVFLDHIYPKELTNKGEAVPSGDFAHPHRGIATFSYVFSGNLSHYDSRGNKSKIGPGGVQWMKAGNGIIHDEQPFIDGDSSILFHSLQFWVNLPSKVKSEEPEYQAVQSRDIPEIILPNDTGVVRILLGQFGTVDSSIKTFSREFIFHFKLNPKSRFEFDGRVGLEYAAFVPTSEIIINDSLLANSKIAVFSSGETEIILENPNISPVDVLIFGGEAYTEPIIGEGPFVMNSRAQIAEAYRDFFEGKYGIINY